MEHGVFATRQVGRLGELPWRGRAKEGPKSRVSAQPRAVLGNHVIGTISKQLCGGQRN